MQGYFVQLDTIQGMSMSIHLRLTRYTSQTCPLNVVSVLIAENQPRVECSIFSWESEAPTQVGAHTQGVWGMCVW